MVLEGHINLREGHELLMRKLNSFKLFSHLLEVKGFEEFFSGFVTNFNLVKVGSNPSTLSVVVFTKLSLYLNPTTKV